MNEYIHCNVFVIFEVLNDNAILRQNFATLVVPWLVTRFVINTTCKEIYVLAIYSRCQIRREWLFSVRLVVAVHGIDAIFIFKIASLTRSPWVWPKTTRPSYLKTTLVTVAEYFLTNQIDSNCLSSLLSLDCPLWINRLYHAISLTVSKKYKGESLRKHGKCNKNCKYSEVVAGISGHVASNWAELSDTQIDTSCIELCDIKSGRHTIQDPASKFGSLSVVVAFALFSQRFPPFSSSQYFGETN